MLRGQPRVRGGDSRQDEVRSLADIAHHSDCREAQRRPNVRRLRARHRQDEHTVRVHRRGQVVTDASGLFRRVVGGSQQGQLSRDPRAARRVCRGRVRRRVGHADAVHGHRDGKSRRLSSAAAEYRLVVPFRVGTDRPRHGAAGSRDAARPVASRPRERVADRAPQTGVDCVPARTSEIASKSRSAPARRSPPVRAWVAGARRRWCYRSGREASPPRRYDVRRAWVARSPRQA